MQVVGFLADLWAYWGDLHIYVCHPRKTPCLSRTSRDQTLGLRVILHQISFESCSWLEVCAMVLNRDKGRIAAPQITQRWWPLPEEALRPWWPRWMRCNQVSSIILTWKCWPLNKWALLYTQTSVRSMSTKFRRGNKNALHGSPLWNCASSWLLVVDQLH